jgi:hypothetical protein
MGRMKNAYKALLENKEKDNLGETGLEEKKNIKRCPKGRVSDSIVPI